MVCGTKLSRSLVQRYTALRFTQLSPSSQRIGPKTKTTRGLRLRHFPAQNTGHPIYFVLNSDWFVDLSEFVTIG